MNISQQKIFLFQALEGVFGKDYVRKKYIENCIRTYNKTGIIYIHIPKAGGTTITKELYGKRVGHTPACLVRDIMGESAFSSFFSFSVSRNPYDRIVSSFHYATQGGGTIGGIRNRSLYKAPEFNTFEKFIKEWLIYKNICSLDPVFKPQFLFVSNNERKFLVNWMGKIENPGEIESLFSLRFGRKIILNKTNTSKHKDYRLYFNDELQELVYNYYKIDFDILGYQKDL